MRPKTTRGDLPGRSAIRSKIISEFNSYISNMKLTFQQIIGDVSINWDTWTAPYTSTAFLGLCAQWIDMKADGWVFRSEVLAMHQISGPHNGDNLGRYVIKLLDRVGVTSKTSNKVRGQACSLPSSYLQQARLRHCGQCK